MDGSRNSALLLTPRRSRRLPAETLLDLDYADNNCLLSEHVEQAQELLTSAEIRVEVGLGLSAK